MCLLRLDLQCKSSVIIQSHERYSAHLFQQGFIKAKNYPTNTSVEVMTEGGESGMFKHLFKSWRDKGQTQGLGTTYSVGKIGNLCVTCD